MDPIDSDLTHLGPSVCQICGDFSSDCYLLTAWREACGRCKNFSYINEDESECGYCGHHILVTDQPRRGCGECLRVDDLAA